MAQQPYLMFYIARQTAVRPAIQVAGDSSWFLLRRQIEPSGTRIIMLHKEDWDKLVFKPGVEMTLGGAANLPFWGQITAVGFYYQNAEPADVTDDLELRRINIEARVEEATLFASEPFWTLSTGYNGMVYSSNNNIGGATNKAIVIGNAGFDEANAWQLSNDRLQPSNGYSLEHPGTTQTVRDGCAQVRVNNFKTPSYRCAWRRMAPQPPTVDTYYMSGLVMVNALDLNSGELAAMGFSNWESSHNIALTNGFHIGVYRDGGETFLAAFAGKEKFPLMELDESATGRVWQVVLKLDVEAEEPDKLTAWYAADDATLLERAFKSRVVETWESPVSIEALRLTSCATGRSGSNSDTATPLYFDEARLGATLESVTALPEPPPYGTLIMLE